MANREGVAGTACCIIRKRGRHLIFCPSEKNTSDALTKNLPVSLSVSTEIHRSMLSGGIYCDWEDVVIHGTGKSRVEGIPPKWKKGYANEES
jgi:hypothetical protein